MPATTLLCPVMVGRETPLATLGGHLELARDGVGHALLIAGEAGIGKSRFVAEAKERAIGREMRTLQGNCFEPDRAFPYAPLIDLLRDLVAGATADAADGANALIGTAAPELVKLSPEIAAWLPDVAPAPPMTPEQEQRRLFHALAQTLTRVARRQPTLIVLEDIHWCDDNSLEFLQFFARQMTALPILLALTFRSDEVHEGLRHFLATLVRQRFATEIELGRLNAGELDTMLRAMFARPTPVQAEFLHRLYGLSEGNPFFTEEIINALITAGDIVFANGQWGRKPLHEIQLPRTLRDAVLRRSERLTASAHDLLSTAAVAGRRFDITLLESLTGCDEAQMIGLIKELMRAQLVVEESTDQFAFRHALTQQVIYTDLLARERATLHGAIAYQIERISASTPEGHLAELARHFHEAGEWSKSLEYATLAGERAQALYAPRAAVEQFTRALSAAQHLGQPASQTVLLARGKAYEMLGEFALAQTDFEAALSQAAQSQNQTAEWNALVNLGMLWAGRNYQKTGDYYRQALAETMGDAALLARSLNRVGNWHANHEEPVEAQHLHMEALTITEANDDSEGVAETCDFLGMAYLLGSDLVQSADYCQRAIALYRPANQQLGLSSSLATLGICAVAYQCRGLTPASLPAPPQSYCEEAIRIAEAIGQRSGEAYAWFNLGSVLGPQGKWSDALKAAHNSLAIAEEIEHRQWMCATLTSLNCIFDDLLDLDTARRYGERALEIATSVDSALWIHNATAFLASTCVRQGDLARAEAALRAVGGASTSVTTMGEHLLGRAQVELSLARRAFIEALDAVDSLIAHTPNATIDHHSPALALLRGTALAANGRPDEAEACLLAGIAAAQTCGDRANLRYLYRELANLYRHERRHDDLARTLEAATALTQELAEAITDPAQREAFFAKAMAGLPGATAHATRAVTAHSSRATQHYGGLTLREREVAAAIAQGMSNRAIAEQLVVSERTVESHVSNILGKLGFTTRTQIATWAVARKLLDGE